MASRYFAIAKQHSNPENVTEGSSTGSKDVELVVDLTNSPTRAQVLQAVRAIEGYVQKCNWPPA